MFKEVSGEKVKENCTEQHSKSRKELENKKEILLGERLLYLIRKTYI